MEFQIDAWFERIDPIIRVRDAKTGRELLRLEAEQVQALMESGDICVSDLESGSTQCAELVALAKQQTIYRNDPSRLRVRDYRNYLRVDSASATTFDYSWKEA
jgi:hypothetical protein